MTLIINNKEVEQVLTMEDTIAALEQSYLQRDPARNYQWGVMEGGSTGGYFAIRVKSEMAN